MTLINKSSCPGYDIEPSNGEPPVLDLWEIRSTPSLPLLPGPLWPGVVVTDRDLYMGQIELFDIWTVCKQITYATLNS